MTFIGVFLKYILIQLWALHQVKLSVSTQKETPNYCGFSTWPFDFKSLPSLSDLMDHFFGVISPFSANTGLLHPDRSAQRVLQLQQNQQHRPQHGVPRQLQASVSGSFTSLFSSLHLYFLFKCALTHPSLPGGRPASDLHVDHGGAAGVQPQRKPERPDVVRLPALPGTRQPGPQLELPAAKSYPFIICCGSQTPEQVRLIS